MKVGQLRLSKLRNRKEKNEENWTESETYGRRIKHININIMGASEIKEMEAWAERIYEEIITKTSQNSWKN